MEGSHFDYVVRETAKSALFSKNKRFFGDLYDAFPIFSPDQTLVCMKRKSVVSFMTKPNIDVFRCGTEEFFISNEPLSNKSEDFAFSLKLDKNNIHFVDKIRFS